MPFTARQLVSPPIHERAEVQQPGDGIEVHEALRRCASLSVLEIRGHAQVRKQSRILEHVADTTVFGRHIEPPLGIQQHDVIERYPAGVGIEKSGNGIDEGALAAARAAEQRHHPRCRQLEVCIQRKGSTPFLDRYAEHQRPNMRRTRRANHSDNIRPVRPRANEMQAKRAAAVSPPGVCSAE